jgi:hypothetical protein
MSQDSKAEPQPHVDVDAVAVTAFGLAEVLHPGPSVWHAHGKHQPLYAAHGMLHLETEDGQWLLPPQRRRGCARGVAVHDAVPVG